MKTFYCGLTNAGNIAVHEPNFDLAWEKYIYVLRTSQWVIGANFPGEICKTEIRAETAYAAAERFHGEKLNVSVGETHAWELQRAADHARNELHLQAFHDQMAAERAALEAQAAAMTIGQLRARLTHKQFCNILEAARRGNDCGRHATDWITANELGKKLSAALRVKRERRDKFGYGWKPVKIKPWEIYEASNSDKWHHPLARFYNQLARNKRERERKKAAALAKRREPMRRLVLHMARQFHRHKPNFGQRGDGIEYGTGHGNTGSRRRGGPGTRCTAGVTYDKGKITFWPTHNGKPVSIPAPPMKLRKRARPGIAHPDGLFCRASDAFGGVDENYDYNGEWILRGYSIRGVRISEQVARREFTVADALAETNLEVRRVMVELLPPDALLSSGALTEIHRDDFGVLYRCEHTFQWDRLTIVKVINSTPEPDGTFKDYFLRVPGNMARAKQAVAWTFGLTEEQYQPLAQS